LESSYGKHQIAATAAFTFKNSPFVYRQDPLTYNVRPPLIVLRIGHIILSKLKIKTPMGIFWTFVLAAIVGYVFGYYIRPNQRLRKAIREAREKCRAVLEEGNRGVYKTIVTDQNKSSELVAEVKELAVTQNGQVKVQYLSAFYKNPEFRTRKGDALLKEVHGLLGDYLPRHEIEWYETAERHEKVREHLNSLDSTQKR
jgi:hypothetical protein